MDINKLSEEQQPKYIFPKFLAEAMSKIDQRTQFEASMMSMSLMLVGLIITIGYFIVYFNFPLWYKIVLGLNGLAGFVFMASMLTTTFQQYRTHMEIILFQQEQKNSKIEPQMSKSQKNDEDKIKSALKEIGFTGEIQLEPLQEIPKIQKRKIVSKDLKGGYEE